MQNNFIQINQTNYNFNFLNFLRSPEGGPKPKLPVKDIVVGVVISLLAGIGGSQAPSRLKVEVISPANGSVFTADSTVPLVARATTAQGTITTVTFRVNGVKVGRAETQAD